MTQTPAPSISRPTEEWCINCRTVMPGGTVYFEISARPWCRRCAEPYLPGFQSVRSAVRVLLRAAVVPASVAIVWFFMPFIEVPTMVAVGCFTARS